MFNTSVSDIQSDVVVADGQITGTLKWLSEGDIADYWQPGNFIALKFGAVPEGTTVKAGLSPSAGSGLVELDEDMNGVWKITGSHAQKFVVEATKGTQVETQTFKLSGLTLEPEPEDDAEDEDDDN